MPAKRAAGRTGQYGALALYVIFLAAPLAWVISISFKPGSELYMLTQSWIPASPTLENYVAVFSELNLLQAVGNSLIVSTSAAAGTVVLGLPAAYLMARHRGPLTSGLTGWILASQMFPFILVLIPLFLMMVRLGLFNTHAGLILVYMVWSLPFAVWMLRNYLRSIPIEIEQAAALDRANSVQIMTKIIAPLAAPGIVVAFLFAFIGAWNEFMFALVLLRDTDLNTLSLALVRFIGDDGGVRMGPLAAASVLSAIPNLLLFIFLQRRLVQGLLGGSVRG